MKIMMFRGGQPGALVQLSGDQPERELEELLEGAVEWRRLCPKFCLVVRMDGEAERLPIRYAVHQLGREPEPVAGDCAVVALGVDRSLGDIAVADIPNIALVLRRV